MSRLPEAGGREALAEGGGDASGHENVLGRRRVLHGVLAYPRGRARRHPTHRTHPPELPASAARASTAATRPAGGVDAVDGRPPACRSVARTRPIWPAPSARSSRRPRHRRPAGRGRRPGRPGSCRRRRPPARRRPPRAPRRRAPGLLRGTAHQLGAGEALQDRGGLAVAGLPLRLGRGDRPAEQLADPVVRRRLGAHGTVGLLGLSWLPRVSTSDFSPVADQRRAHGVGAGDRASGHADLLRAARRPRRGRRRAGSPRPPSCWPAGRRRRVPRRRPRTRPRSRRAAGRRRRRLERRVGVGGLAVRTARPPREGRRRGRRPRPARGRSRRG